jgi:ribose transport system permease protein
VVNIFFCLASPYYFSLDNFLGMIYEAAVPTTISMGLTIVVIVGSFDLSVGAICSFGGMLTATLMPSIGTIPAALISLMAVSLFGLVNGVLVGIVGISGIIVTLAMQFVSTGIEIGITGGYEIAIPISFKNFLAFGSGSIGPFKYMVFALICLTIIGHVFMTKTVYGLRLSATGDNPLAAIYSGVKIKFLVTLAFIISAIFSAIAGIMVVAMNASHQPVVGKGYLLDAFAIVFLGSTILKEGKPHILGTAIAGIVLSSLVTGMMMLGVRYEWQMFIKGAVLIGAVGVSVLLRREEIVTRFV